MTSQLTVLPVKQCVLRSVENMPKDLLRGGPYETLAREKSHAHLLRLVFIHPHLVHRTCPSRDTKWLPPYFYLISLIDKVFLCIRRA